MKSLAAKFDQELMDTFIKKTGIQSQLDRPGVDPCCNLLLLGTNITTGTNTNLSHMHTYAHNAYRTELLMHDHETHEEH